MRLGCIGKNRHSISLIIDDIITEYVLNKKSYS